MTREEIAARMKARYPLQFTECADALLEYVDVVCDILIEENSSAVPSAPYYSSEVSEEAQTMAKQAESTNEPTTSYDALKREIEYLPSTWVPGLTRALIERGLRDVWKGDEGFRRFVENVLTQLAQ